MRQQLCPSARPRRERREGERPGDITLTQKVVWARARLWHLPTVHIIVFASDWEWRLCCTGQPIDEGFDIWPDPPTNCDVCDRVIQWDGAVRRGSYDGTFWAY
jgi:hypothetical protein